MAGKTNLPIGYGWLHQVTVPHLFRPFMVTIVILSSHRSFHVQPTYGTSTIHRFCLLSVYDNLTTIHK
jgi:hypothetical protein